MQIILLEKVVNVGDLGDVVTVKQGYARNYLIPQGKAKRATPENVKIIEEKRTELERAAGQKLAAAQGAGSEDRRSRHQDHAEGRSRRTSVRLRHQRRHRRSARRAGIHRRKGAIRMPEGSIEARRRFSARRRALPRRDREHHGHVVGEAPASG